VNPNLHRMVTYPSNLASWGADIVDTPKDESLGQTRVQLVNPRGTMTLLFSMWTNGRWSTIVPVTNPERFMPSEVKTHKDWYAVVNAWCDAGDRAQAEHEAKEATS
jgi:hypothetical protein